eukprot:TRINITY_DN43395_c0_g1_i1.p1 TRINITY_DN43395_c0_g1~~TRINITY_DN43395_c0_g1_i1.p1  ORF type:complete len:234 (+),score=28.89 TRINITY_DN43395_c0_g1_i1:38-739(+)
MISGDKVTVSVRNTFLDFALTANGSGASLKRSSSEGTISSRTSTYSKSNSSSSKTYAWMPSTARDLETMSNSSFASCSETHLWKPPWQVEEDFDCTDAQSVSDAQPPFCSERVKALHEETGMAIEELLTLESDGILEHLPRNDAGEIASVGSMQHSLGTCTPCIFWFRGICTKSIKCPFCHFRHPGQKAKKPNKRTRELLREIKKSKETNENGEAVPELARQQLEFPETFTYQ